MRTNAHRTLRRHEQLGQLLADIGEPVWACGHTAAALLGFDGWTLSEPYHVCVPRSRSIQRVGHVVHTARDVERLDVITVDGIRTSSATRTIVDLAATESPERLTVAIDSALRDRLTSEDFLHRRLVALRRRGRAGIGKVLAVLAGGEAARGGHSWLERTFLTAVARRGLARPQVQRVMSKRGDRLIRVDCHFPGTNVVVELLGYAFHRTRLQMQADAERMNRLQLDGQVVLQFTYVDVVESSPAMFSVLTEALAPRSGLDQNATSASGRDQNGRG